jgi:hypothetical protein
VPDTESTWLMIQATDDFRVPPPGTLGRHFPFTFNIEDYTVITSESVHLPPTVHLFMQATGVYVMNFLPKPAESVPGTERTPWYHRNVDYDEIAFFHSGSLYGIAMPPGLIPMHRKEFTTARRKRCRSGPVARHHDRVDGRLHPRRERSVEAGPRVGSVQPGQPEPAAVHR